MSASLTLVNASGAENQRCYHVLPIFGWLQEYRREWLRQDVVAGLSTAAVVLPKAMAYATIAGLPVQVGLYTAFSPMVVYALLGSSRPLSVSTSTTIAILVATQSAHSPSSLATLTFLTGVALLLASVVKLGVVANSISEPVLIGFKAGIGLTIVVDQCPKLLGIHPVKGSFLHNVLAIIEDLHDTSLATLLLGVTVLAVLITLKRYCPNVPDALVAVGLGISAMALFQLQNHGVESVGHIPSGLPPWTLPDLSLVLELWPGSLALAVMSFTETIAAGRAFAINEEPALKANQELLATGCSNLVGSLCGSMPSGGGTTQTAVNRSAGAKTQVAALTTAAAGLVTMTLLAPLIELMPEATLAAVVIVYSIGLVSPAEFLAIYRVRRMEFMWALVAFAGVVLLGTLKGIVVAIVVSLLSLLWQAVKSPVFEMARVPGSGTFRPVSAEHPDDEKLPGLLMVRIEGRVFFANAEQIAEQIRPLIAASQPKVVIMDLSAVIDFEYTALQMLIRGEERQRNQGVELWLVGLSAAVTAVVQSSALMETLGNERLFQTLDLAVKHYEDLVQNEAI